MDPNAVRQKMIELANKMLGGQVAAQQANESFVALAIDLAEAVHDLDTWLRAGGFLPDRWAIGDAQVGRKEEV